MQDILRVFKFMSVSNNKTILTNNESNQNSIKIVSMKLKMKYQKIVHELFVIFIKIYLLNTNQEKLLQYAQRYFFLFTIKNNLQ